MFLFMSSEQVASSPPVPLVCFMGIAVVFIGLLMLIALINITNFVLTKFSKTKKEIVKPTENIVSNQKIENRQEIIAAVCAAVAEENNTDISAIRVLSFKRL